MSIVGIGHDDCECYKVSAPRIESELRLDTSVLYKEETREVGKSRKYRAREGSSGTDVLRLTLRQHPLPVTDESY